MSQGDTLAPFGGAAQTRTERKKPHQSEFAVWMFLPHSFAVGAENTEKEIGRGKILCMNATRI
ncbi:hypothetical protein DP116_08280 [Brasilonema bromeliae SPC951]|uniref:Uncharacterized protein n=1 Tax=Brasilonema bromeliae SPC951 TaxID=385972 RepID=A0ABX1P6Y0_9CYAN|nr:hypothetical protein [Brasilonema bromeliae SPC951]